MQATRHTLFLRMEIVEIVEMAQESEQGNMCILSSQMSLHSNHGILRPVQMTQSLTQQMTIQAAIVATI